MIGRRRRVAKAVMRWSARLLPAERKQWVEALRAEIDAIENDSAALDFALGCFWMSAKARFCRIELFIGALCIGIPTGLLALAALAAQLSGRHGGAETQVGMIFGSLFVIFGSGAGLFLAKGATALARFAGMLVPIYLGLLLFLHSPHELASDKRGAAFFRALAIEGVAIWSMLLLGALFVVRAQAMRHSGRRGRL